MTIETRLELAIHQKYLKIGGVLLGKKDSAEFYKYYLSNYYNYTCHHTIKNETDFYMTNPMFMGKRVYRTDQDLDDILLILNN